MCRRQMAITERHTSPDMLLVLIVDVTAGDWTIGFEGGPWHTHGDILDACGYDGPPAAGMRAFVDDILQSRRAIAVVRVDGRICDIVVPDDPDGRQWKERSRKYARPNETVELRYWDGKPAGV